MSDMFAHRDVTDAAEFCELSDGCDLPIGLNQLGLLHLLRSSFRLLLLAFRHSDQSVCTSVLLPFDQLPNIFESRQQESTRAKPRDLTFSITAGCPTHKDHASLNRCKNLRRLFMTISW